MIIKIKRLFHGYASVRDSQVMEAYKKGEGILIDCNGESMAIPHGELMAGVKMPKRFRSLHNPSEYYYLIDYPWRPDSRQEQLFQSYV